MDFVDFDNEIIFRLAYKRRQTSQEHSRIYTGQLGQYYVQELLDSAHPERIYNALQI